MRGLEGKTALVTGGARGVGASTVRKLAASGATVIINCFHSWDAGKELKAELSDAGATIDLIRASVAKPNAVDKMFDELEERHEQLDFLVNNAASGTFASLQELTEATIDKALDTNFKGSLWCAKRAGAWMSRFQSGSIVNVSSIGSTMVPANYLSVGTSKAALEALTRYLAVEYGKDNIRVNTASAGMVDGEVATRFPSAASMRQVITDAAPLGRLATEDELAEIILFLLSEHSRYVTGQTILADGGLSLGSRLLSPTDSPDEPAKPDNQVIHPQNQNLPALSETVSQKEEPSSTENLIAVVGMGVMVPGANNPSEFWNVLTEGPELFRSVPSDRWEEKSFESEDRSAEDKTYQSRSAFIQDSSETDKTKASDATNPPEDSTISWLRESVHQALEDVSYDKSMRTSAIFGYTADGSQHLEESLVVNGLLKRLEEAGVEINNDELATLRNELLAQYGRALSPMASTFPHSVGRAAVQDALGTDAPVLMVDTACSSSLYAIDIAMKRLLEGSTDLVVAGGAFAVGPRNSVLFAKLKGLSPSGEVRPLDASCDGVLFSDGAGAVVLKRASDAQAAGDNILGYVNAFGSSSDGKGKAIYAPKVAGQQMAVQRTYDKTGPRTMEKLRWVVAHATGTPAGDLCETTSLTEELSAEDDILVTSNKSLIGHTGWAAGVASVIQVLLALENDTITQQHRFSTPSDKIASPKSGLRVPTKDVDWPRSDQPRIAAVSGFGFGGTNAHLVVSDSQLEDNPSSSSTETSRTSIVAIGANLPNLSAEETREWFATTNDLKTLTLGELHNDLGAKLRIPPPTRRTLDRTQLMALSCAEQIKETLGEVWDEYAERTAVILGHMGPTRHSALYAQRCYLDDATPQATAVIGERRWQQIRDRVTSLVPPSNEDSFPGIMPNVIPARISNYFNLNGPNMTIDTGFSSAISAIEVGADYLTAGDVDLVLAGGINGNNLPEIADALQLGDTNLDVAEGAVLFALMRENDAIKHGIDVVATITPGDSTQPTATANSGLYSGRSSAHFLGADAAIALAKELNTAQTGNESSKIQLSAFDETGSLERELSVSVERPGSDGITPTHLDPTSELLPSDELELSRYAVKLHPDPSVPLAAHSADLPDGAVVVTNVANQLDLASTSFVISNNPIPDSVPGVQIEQITPSSVIDALAKHRELHGPIRHVRAIVDVTEETVISQLSPTLNIHDLVFLTLQACSSDVQVGGDAFLIVLNGVNLNGSLHPASGLFTGIFKSLFLEWPETNVRGVCTDSADIEVALRALTTEIELGSGFPITCWINEERHTFRFHESPSDRSEPSRINQDSVILSIGGGRGITSELLKATARRSSPKIYVVGSSDVEAAQTRIQSLKVEGLLDDRSKFLQKGLQQLPKRSVAEITREFDALTNTATVLDNLAELRSVCGHDRVIYKCANVLDADAIQTVVDDVYAENSEIDLLIHAAGINRAAAIENKSLQDFWKVRDLKVVGYQNLKVAFGEREPGLWLNFGSFIGLTGQSGEVDYGAANDFLATAAKWNTSKGKSELTVGWTLWGEVGLGAHPVTSSFLEKSGLFTRMKTVEGISHFLDEISSSQTDGAVFHIGEAEQNAINEKIPGFFSDQPTSVTKPGDSKPAGTSPDALPFYVDRVVEQTDSYLVAERLFDSERDSYLHHHVVNGQPTLPGLFVPEMSAQVAKMLVPELSVVGFQNLGFHHFLRIIGRLKANDTKHITAEITARGPSSAIVTVRITGDVVAPNGTVLQKDRLHFDADVLLGTHGDAPSWQAWPERGSFVPVPDPYHLPGSPVLLTEKFVTTTDTGIQTLGKQATYVPPVESDDPVFSTFITPCLMLDGLARVGVLDKLDGRYIPIAAPRSIRSIDLFEPVSDATLANSKFLPLELYASPPDLNLEAEEAQNQFVAAHSGKKVAQMLGITGVVIGYYDLETESMVQSPPLSSNPSSAAAAML